MEFPCAHQSFLKRTEGLRPRDPSEGAYFSSYIAPLSPELLCQHPSSLDSGLINAFADIVPHLRSTLSSRTARIRSGLQQPTHHSVRLRSANLKVKCRTGPLVRSQIYGYSSPVIASGFNDRGTRLPHCRLAFCLRCQRLSRVLVFRRLDVFASTTRKNASRQSHQYQDVRATR